MQFPNGPLLRNRLYRPAGSRFVVGGDVRASTPGFLEGLTEGLIDAGMQQSRAAQPRRTYLGASRLGVSGSTRMTRTGSVWWGDSSVFLYGSTI